MQVRGRQDEMRGEVDDKILNEKSGEIRLNGIRGGERYQRGGKWLKDKQDKRQLQDIK